MKIVIHGTKGGYHTFTAERISGFIDARPDYNKVAAIGQEAYAINFNNYNAVLSKYKIIRDVAGEKRMGNVAFSVIIPNNKKFSGADAKALLDKLSAWYCTEYIDGDNLNNVRENWSVVEELTRDYENKLQTIPADEVENIQQGTGEAAFVYYSSDMELEKYLAEPYQQEYKKFKQIFFVKNELDGQAENPLNALRHNPSNNLTGQIDLNNPWYKLLFNENARNGVKIEVLVNGLRCKNNSKIRRKSDLEISYSKQYHHGESITSKWDEINTEFVDVNDAAQTITIREKELTPKTKPIKFEVKDGKKKTITDADVFCENHRTKEEKKVINNEAVFKGEEVRDKWVVRCTKDSLEGLKEFIPEHQYGPVALVLEESKIVTFNVKDDDDKPVNNYKVKVYGKSTSPNDVQIKFVGNEIDKNWDITISRNGYESTFTYRPATGDNPKDVRLRKMQPSNGESTKEKHYKVSAGKHGKLKDGNSYLSFRRDGHDVIDKIIPKRGYEFNGFELDDNTLTAIYRKSKPLYKKQFFFPVTVLSIIVLLYVFKYAMLKLSPKDKSGEIISYCDGNDLFPNVLEDYQKTYCKESKPDYCKKIKNALEIRAAINEGNIDQLKTMDYSFSQDSLKKTIHSVNEKFKEKIGITLQAYPASKLNLLEVADVITKLQKLLQIPVNNLRSERDCDDRLQLIKGWELPEELAIVKNITEQINTKKAKFNEREDDNSVNNTQTKETNNTLTNNSTSNNSTNNNSSSDKQTDAGKSKFEKKFWKLLNDGVEKKETYDALRNSYNSQNAAPADIKILNYLKAITKDSESFLKFLRIVPRDNRLNATKLSDISIE